MIIRQNAIFSKEFLVYLCNNKTESNTLFIFHKIEVKENPTSILLFSFYTVFL